MAGLRKVVPICASSLKTVTKRQASRQTRALSFWSTPDKSEPIVSGDPSIIHRAISTTPGKTHVTLAGEHEVGFYDDEIMLSQRYEEVTQGVTGLLTAIQALSTLAFSAQTTRCQCLKDGQQIMWNNTPCTDNCDCYSIFK